VTPVCATAAGFILPTVVQPVSRDDVTVTEYLALAGVALATAGTYVPWVVTNPRVQVVPAVHLNGMG
jgi:hypothetical protein